MKGKVLKAIKIARKQLLGHGIINHQNKGVINFIDVGALGDLPEPWFTNSKHISKLLSFEPLEEGIKRKNIITSDSALWEKDATLPFYIYQGLGGSGSSLFKQNYQYVEQNYEILKKVGNPWLAETWFERSQLAEERTLNCTTLDNVLQKIEQPNGFDFLKIDAQGAEYQILKGGEEFLSENCLGLQLELFNVPLYEGIKLLPEVEEYLKQKGFEMAKKLPAHGSFNSQNDCIFLRKEYDKSDAHKIRIISEIYKL